MGFGTIGLLQGGGSLIVVAIEAMASRRLDLWLGGGLVATVPD
jgi:hypothetical protein